jgi:hypothetical protein
MTRQEKPTVHTSSDRIIVLSLARESRVLSIAPDGSDMRVLVDGLESKPDGVTVDPVNRHLYYTFMGVTRDGEDFWENEGYIERANYDGSGRQVIVPMGGFVTGKQITFDHGSRRLYWCDREGMRVMSCRTDGSDLRVLVQTGSGQDRLDPRRHCVGVAIDRNAGHLYWTLKGKPDGNEGRIMRMPVQMTPGDPARRSDIETVLDGLPEPIDLEWDEANDVLYWTDRGDPPRGNTLNRASIRGGKPVDHEVLLSNLQEAIGVALDLPNRRAFVSDLGGRVSSVHLDHPGEGTVIFQGQGKLTGIAYLRG